MSKLKRFIALGPIILLKKAVGFEEVFAVGVRPPNRSEYVLSDYSRDFWYADPIAFKYGDTRYLFTEAYDRKSHIGHIAVSEIADDGRISAPRMIIKEDYHMSFPYVFEWNGEIFMIPETSDNMTINLYKSTGFPYNWELFAQFPTSEPVVDAIVTVVDDSKLHLLASTYNPDAPLYVKYLEYCIENKGGELTCHKEENKAFRDWNLMDRNAGKPVANGDGILIPTQESSETDYGIRVNFRRRAEGYVPEDAVQSAIELKDIRYADNISRNNLIGVHTYSRIDDFEIIDIRYYKYTFGANIRRLSRMLNHFRSGKGNSA